MYSEALDLQTTTEIKNPKTKGSGKRQVHRSLKKLASQDNAVIEVESFNNDYSGKLNKKRMRDKLGLQMKASEMTSTADFSLLNHAEQGEAVKIPIKCEI